MKKNLAGVLLALTVLAAALGAAGCAGSVTVTFYLDGEPYASAVCAPDGTADLPDGPEREGFTFLGWSREEGEASGIVSGDTVFDADTALYGVWEEIPSYTVTFRDHDGRILPVGGRPDQRVRKGEAATPPEAPSREGYTFTGWDVPFDEIVRQTTVTATYAVNRYRLTLWSLGERYGEQTPEYGSETVLPRPSREGLSFEGWYFDEAFLEPADLGGGMPAREVDVYARWSLERPAFSLSSDAPEDLLTYGGSAVLTVSVPETEGLSYRFRWSLSGTPLEGETERTLSVRPSSAGDLDCTAEVTVSGFGLPETSAAKHLTLRVGKAPLVVSAEDASVVYGEPAPGFFARFAGLVNGEDASALGEPSFETSYAARSPVRPEGYAVTPGGLSSDNYSIRYASGTLTVERRRLSVRARDASVVYGAAYVGKGEADFEGFAPGEEVSVLTGTLSLASDYAPGAGAGAEFPLNVSGLSSGNYEISYLPGTLRVARAELTVRVGDAETVYGSPAPAFGAELSGFVLGEDESVLKGSLSFETAYVPGSDAGEYAVTASGLSAENYALRSEPGRLTVRRAPRTIDLSGVRTQYVYTGERQTVEGGAVTEGEGALEYLNNTFLTVAEGNGKTVTVRAAQSRNHLAAEAQVVLSVSRAPLEVRAEDASVVYGEPAPAFSLRYTGFLGTDGAQELRGTPEFATAYAAGSPVTDAGYEILPRGLEADNYELSFRAGALAVLPREASVSVTAAVKYSGEPWKRSVWEQVPGLLAGHALSGTLATSGSAAGEYRQEGEGPLSDFSWESSAVVSDAAGADVTKNYRLVYSLSVTISESTIECTVRGYTGTYDGAPHPGAEVTGLDPADASVQYRTAEGGYSSEAPVFRDAGDYTVSYRITAENFAPLEGEAAVRILPAPLEVRAEDASVTYGEPAPSFSVRFAGFVPGEDESALAGTLSFDTEYAAGSPVTREGYPVMPGGLSSGNYAVSFVPGTLAVRRAARTVDVSGVQTAYVYTGSSQTVTGAVLSDGEGTLVYEGHVFLTVAEGDGRIVTIRAAETQNYLAAEAQVVLSVSRAPLEVRAEDASVTYGEPAPAFSARCEGFVGGEDETVLSGALSFETEYAAGSRVRAGGYPVMPGGLSSENYAVTFVPGTLTVAKRAAEVRAEDKSATYGDEPPVYTAAFENLFGTEDAEAFGAPVLSCAYERGMDAGRYPISVSGPASDDYEFRFLEGTLTVGRASYAGITHDAVNAEYRSGLTLAGVPLREGFRWKDSAAALAVGRTVHAALYNMDTINYEDFALEIAVEVEKGTVVISDVPLEYDVGTVTSISASAAQDGEPADALLVYDVSGVDFSRGGTYAAGVRVDEADPNYTGEPVRVAVKIRSVLSKADGALYTLEDALALEGAGTLVVTADTSPTSEAVRAEFSLYAGAEYSTVRPGVLLLLPYSDAHSESEEDVEGTEQAFTRGRPYVTLDLGGAPLTVEGSLLVNAKRAAGTPIAGNVCGANYACLRLGEGCILTVKGSLASVGYTMGAGTVVAEPGAVVKDVLPIWGFKGGRITYAIKNKAFPFNQYTISNIEVPLALKQGARFYAKAYAVTSIGTLQKDIYFIGTGGESDAPLIEIVRGEVRKLYDAATGRVTLQSLAEISFHDMTVSVSGMSMSTKGLEMPFPGNFRIELSEGSVTNLGIGVKLLAGASLHVAKGAVLNLLAGGKLMSYGGSPVGYEKDVKAGHTYVTEGWQDGGNALRYPIAGVESYYPVPPVFGYDADTPAELLVEGTLNAASGAALAGRLSAKEGAEFRPEAGAGFSLTLTEDFTYYNQEGFLGFAKAYFYTASSTLTGTVDGVADASFEAGRAYAGAADGSWQTLE